MKKIILFLMINITFLFAGLESYNLGTWNLQGSSAATESKWNVSIRQLMTGDNALDVLAVQEAGVLPSSARDTGRQVQPVGVGIPIHEYEWNLGTLSRPQSVFIYYSRIDVGANRVNMAIVSRTRADEVIVIPHPSVASARPVIGIRIGNDAFFSVHALASGGADAAAAVTAVDNFFATRAGIDYIIMGDFNREPDLLMRDLDASLRNRLRVVAPPSFTQVTGRRVIDYALTGTSTRTAAYTPPLLSAVLAVAGLRTFLASDHFPVNFRRF
ncbi:cytolethal distending toxin subunit B family protein [Campylobacter insulaenigrae]|uniref:cytolethal distending toxin subunit B family protein n=1 Tax=Campylobacter insulaenigrae TaxID=260714 RepID=UPI002153209D|nr:cytolethal distending toxin subunit B family protein [Campylobacter insulaenigrae]MCR6570412.1 cytolethal distending toxin subunit B family protein [Campylobacter insulaenigrae]MCR6573738.1 cytolethal distending toxin subunit B family protein [Campylobacter insulaenigrae]MCR6575453.1 cytolethal distending toxin subunit B family protein [Campylobacter insulaenigrae]MCR6576832.1 cytolethal distending toxin subunit B family protein [Campylobacter insulaenigrae]MCR6578194.1 cytolethal distendin